MMFKNLDPEVSLNV